jgi:hypothetical protein
MLQFTYILVPRLKQYCFHFVNLLNIGNFIFYNDFDRFSENYVKSELSANKSSVADPDLNLLGRGTDPDLSVTKQK